MPNQLDHEKLDVYQLELQFVAWSTELMAELLVSSEAKARRVTETCDHPDCFDAVQTGGPVFAFVPGL